MLQAEGWEVRNILASSLPWGADKWLLGCRCMLCEINRFFKFLIPGYPEPRPYASRLDHMSPQLSSQSLLLKADSRVLTVSCVDSYLCNEVKTLNLFNKKRLLYIIIHLLNLD